MTRFRKPAATRRGFTLVELLVVLTIILVLVALSASVYYRAAAAQQVSTTKVILKTVAAQMDTQWKNVTDQARQESIPAAYRTTIFTLAGGDPKRAQVIWIKARQKQAFPQTFDEVFNSTGPLPGLDTYRAKLTARGVPAGNNPPAPYESAVLLLMALERNVGGAGLDTSALEQYTANFALPSGQTIPGLRDAWNQPLVFCRWPTGMPEVSGPRPGTDQDPADPEGLLRFPSWLANTTQVGNFQTQLHSLPTQQTQSYHLIPVLVSSGPDKMLGQNPQTLAYTGNQSYDNLYSPPLE
jgi:prepilin-type N-terminal cleavage/methylation domain-containing protein